MAVVLIQSWSSSVRPLIRLSRINRKSESIKKLKLILWYGCRHKRRNLTQLSIEMCRLYFAAYPPEFVRYHEAYRGDCVSENVSMLYSISNYKIRIERHPILKHLSVYVMRGNFCRLIAKFLSTFHKKKGIKCESIGSSG